MEGEREGGYGGGCAEYEGKIPILPPTPAARVF